MDRYIVFGIPFMSYAFDQHGRDYVGLSPSGGCKKVSSLRPPLQIQSPSAV
jgi:hypothetical protein